MAARMGLAAGTAAAAASSRTGIGLVIAEPTNEPVLGAIGVPVSDPVAEDAIVAPKGLVDVDGTGGCSCCPADNNCGTEGPLEATVTAGAIVGWIGWYCCRCWCACCAATCWSCCAAACCCCCWIC